MHRVSKILDNLEFAFMCQLCLWMNTDLRAGFLDGYASTFRHPNFEWQSVRQIFGPGIYARQFGCHRLAGLYR